MVDLFILSKGLLFELFESKGVFIEKKVWLVFLVSSE